MDELKKQLADLGMSDEMAEQTIATVAAFVKSKLPASSHSMIDDLLAGKTPDLGGLLGGFFGK